MSNELESARAMVMNLESFGVDDAGYDETETEPPSSVDHVSGHSDCTFPDGMGMGMGIGGSVP